MCVYNLKVLAVENFKIYLGFHQAVYRGYMLDRFAETVVEMGHSVWVCIEKELRCFKSDFSQ